MLTLLNRFGRSELFAILSITVLAVTMLLFTFLVHPKIKDYLEVARSETNLSSIVSDGDDLDGQIKQFHSDIDQLQRRLHGDMASLPEKEIEAHIVGKLQQISWQNQIQLVGVEPAAGDTIESFHEILFQVNLAGEYMNMYRWLQEVSNELGFVLIKQYEMQAIDDLAENPRLSVKLTMSTYRASR
jgi:Tfp pilus assembly protein PilO